MTVVTPTPLFLKDCLVQIGSDTYEDAVSSVKFTPTASVQTFRAVSPGAVYQQVEEAAWTMELTYVQDWSVIGSLARKLYASEGSALAMTFEPITGGATITSTVTLTPGAIGGDVGAYALGTVSLPCTKPAFTDPT